MMPPSTQHKQDFSAICQTRALSQLLTAETADLLLLGRCFLFVPLTSDPANLHAGHSGRGGWGVGGGGRIMASVRNTLSYPKALEKLSGQTIISLMLHAYVVMRLSTSLTPPKFRRGHLCGECLLQIKLDTLCTKIWRFFFISVISFFKNKKQKTKQNIKRLIGF